MRTPLASPELTAAAAAALDAPHRTTRGVRLRTRAQIVLLAAAPRLRAPATTANPRKRCPASAPRPQTRSACT